MISVLLQTRKLTAVSCALASHVTLFACSHRTFSEPKIVAGTAVDADSAEARSTVGLYFWKHGRAAHYKRQMDKDPRLDDRGRPYATDKDQWKQFCTGTLVDTRVVVTAAHCFQDEFTRYWGDVSVGFGVKPVIEEGYAVRALQVRHHVLYGWSLDNTWYDVALVFLAEDAPQGFVPAKLAAKSTKLSSDDTLIVAGHGQSDATITSSVGTLFKHFANWTKSEPKGDFQTKGVGNSHACFGDSGGPVYLNAGNELLLVGINSREMGGTGMCGTGTEYKTEIAHFRNWIDKQMNHGVASADVDVNELEVRLLVPPLWGSE